MDDLFDDDIDIFFCPYDPDNRGKLPQTNLSAHLTKSLQKLDKPQSLAHAMTDPNFSTSNQKSTHKHRTNSPESVKIENIKQYEVLSNLSLEKKQKNRIAAKQSRDRKKRYVELMEKQQKKLQSEIDKVDNELIDTKKQINTFLKQNKTITGFTSLSQTQAKLQKLLMNDNPESVEEEINFVLDSLMWRMGATGKERVMKLNECFKQIINLSLPALHRYMLWSASEKKHLFDCDKQEKQIENNYFLKEMIEITESKEEHIEELKNLQPAISKQKQKLIGLICKLRQIKQNIEKQSHCLQTEVSTLRDILSPTQCATLTLNVNRNKFRDEINFLKLEKSESQKLRSQPSKKVKLQED